MSQPIAGAREWADQPQLNEPPLEIEGAAAHRDHRIDDEIAEVLGVAVSVNAGAVVYSTRALDAFDAPPKSTPTPEENS